MAQLIGESIKDDPPFSVREAGFIADGYNAEVKAYFAQISEREGKYDWVARCSNAIKRKPRYEVTDFVHEAGFLKK